MMSKEAVQEGFELITSLLAVCFTEQLNELLVHGL